MRVGTSFSEHRASFLGLDPRDSFGRVLQLGPALIRLSAYWDEIRAHGYDELDWLLDRARAADQPILLTVGMKGIQWPEFYIPPELVPAGIGSGACVSADPGLHQAVVEFVTETVSRYKDHPTLSAWQVENEPFNSSGPLKWWIDTGTVRDEIGAVRQLDQRPIVVNTFGHFDVVQDWLSRPHRNPLGVGETPPEQEALDLLGGSDVLGLDLYTAIGVNMFGHEVVHHAASDWADSAGRWLATATAAGKEAWVIECQAEPWEPSKDTYADPKSLDPPAIEDMYSRLAAAGFQTILLWGCEYWLWRADAGDNRWLDAAKRVLASAGQ
jgi:hypothetical protein